ncbi:hypothetical protein [Apilactobacillus xinyiensis]|uniref:hypothetical protein n=1 Tax=Apilactobacillus xinyiensis TaxID=2841032 RepID=UPI001C7D36EB|nr:hypothetical protein [Apilactobacillus xinyiensis]
MLKLITDTINIIGVTGFLVFGYCLLNLLKKQLDSKASHTTGNEHQVYQTASNSIGVLQNVIKCFVANVDNDPVPSNEKKEQAIREGQQFADQHNMNVSVRLLSGMVESAVNELRYKQGLPLPRVDNGTGKPAEQVQEVKTDQATTEQPEYVGDNVGQQKEPFNPNL